MENTFNIFYKQNRISNIFLWLSKHISTFKLTCSNFHNISIHKKTFGYDKKNVQKINNLKFTHA